MSNQKPLKLIDCSKEELVEKVMTARKIYLQQEDTIQSLTNQCAELNAQLQEPNPDIEQMAAQIAKLESEIETLDTTIEGLQEAIREREIQIKSLLNKLQEFGDVALETWCRAKHAYTIIKPYHKTKD